MYAVITENPVSLLRAVKIDANTEELAIASFEGMQEKGLLERIHLIVNLDSGEIRRVYRSADGLKTHASAYEMLGKKTDHEFFEASGEVES